MLRREFIKLTLAAGIGLTGGTAIAADMPAPFDKPEGVKIALVRYLSTGDFFQSYLAGVESQ
ncbi:MAG: LacI family transcriptional regulator, partial [Pseudomonadota bacterium]